MGEFIGGYHGDTSSVDYSLTWQAYKMPQPTLHQNVIVHHGQDVPRSRPS